MKQSIKFLLLLLWACNTLSQKPALKQNEKPWQVVLAPVGLLYVLEDSEKKIMLLSGDKISNLSRVHLLEDAEVVFYHEEMGYFKELSKKGNYRMQDLLPKSASIVSDAAKNARSVIAQEIIAVQQIDTTKIPRRTYGLINEERCPLPDVLLYSCTEISCSTGSLKFFSDSLRMFFYVRRDVDSKAISLINFSLQSVLNKTIVEKKMIGAALAKEYFFLDYNKVIQQDEDLQKYGVFLITIEPQAKDFEHSYLTNNTYTLERADSSERSVVERLLVQAAFEEDSAFELLAKGRFLELLNYPLEAVDCYKRAIEMKPESAWAELFDQENMQRVRMELVEPNFTIFSLHQSAERKQYLKEIYLNRK